MWVSDQLYARSFRGYFDATWLMVRTHECIREWAAMTANISGMQAV